MQRLSLTNALSLFLNPDESNKISPKGKNIDKFAKCLKGTRDNFSIGIALSAIGAIGASFGFTYSGTTLIGYGVTLISFHGKKFFEQIHNIPSKN